MACLEHYSDLGKLKEDPCGGTFDCLCGSCGEAINACNADVGCRTIVHCGLKSAGQCALPCTEGGCAAIVEQHGGSAGASLSLARAVYACLDTSGKSCTRECAGGVWF
jgi:hypothetical protein